MKPSPDLRARRRVPAAPISHAVWLRPVFSLGLRDVAPVLAERGVVVSGESLRRWRRKSGQSAAHGLRRRRPGPGGTGHLDEVPIRIQGKAHGFWPAVGQDGGMPGLPVQSRRDARAAKRFPKKLPRGLRHGPRVVVTDTLRRCGAARREALPHAGRRQGRRLSNRAENARRRRGAEGARGSASSRPATPGGSCPRTARSTAISVQNAIAWRPVTAA